MAAEESGCGCGNCGCGASEGSRFESAAKQTAESLLTAWKDNTKVEIPEQAEEKLLTVLSGLLVRVAENREMVLETR